MGKVVVTLWPEKQVRTLTEVLDYLQKRFGACGDDEWRNILAKGVITDVLQEIFGRYPHWTWQNQVGVFKTEPGVSAYPVDPSWMKLNPYMEILDYNYPINEVSRSEFTYQSESKQQGRPRIFYRSGENMVTLYPTPNVEYEVRWEGTVEPTWIVNETDPLPLPERMYYVLKAGAEEKLHAADNRFDFALRWQGRRFEDMLDREIFNDRRGAKRTMQPRRRPPQTYRYHLTWTYLYG